MVVVFFKIKNIKKKFLGANFSIDVILRMLFFISSNIKANF